MAGKSLNGITRVVIFLRMAGRMKGSASGKSLAGLENVLIVLRMTVRMKESVCGKMENVWQK